MPEQDQKERRLEGQTTITPSSDEAIIATIEQLKSEITDLPSQLEVLEGETLAPIPLVHPNTPQVKLTSKVIRRLVTSSPEDSATGLTIFGERQQKIATRKKVA